MHDDDAVDDDLVALLPLPILNTDALPLLLIIGEVEIARPITIGDNAFVLANEIM